MKLKLFVVAIFSFFVSVANSTPSERDSSISVTRKDSSSVYLLNYAGSGTGTVIVTIKDDNGTTIATKSVRNLKNFRLPLNFSSVAEGIYTMQIDNGSEKETRTINYNNDTAPTYSHVISLGNGRYLLKASHAGTEKISIRIYDGGGDLVFDREEVITGSFAMLFNLKNISGKPSFEVSENSGRSLMILQ